MSKASEAKAAKIEAREQLVSRWRDELLKPSTLLQIRTEYGKGETDYIEVHCYYIGSEGKLCHFDLTSLTAKAWGMKLRETNYRRQIVEGGGGVSKSYKIGTMLFQVLGIEHRETDINWEY